MPFEFITDSNAGHKYDDDWFKGSMVQGSEDHHNYLNICVAASNLNLWPRSLSAMFQASSILKEYVANVKGRLDNIADKNSIGESFNMDKNVNAHSNNI